MKKTIHYYSKSAYFDRLRDHLLDYLGADIVPDVDLYADYEGIAFDLSALYGIDDLTVALLSEYYEYYRNSPSE